MQNKQIFVACDTSNLSEIKKIVKQTQNKKLRVIPKFGLQFFYSKNGRKFLKNFKNQAKVQIATPKTNKKPFLANLAEYFNVFLFGGV